MNPTPPVFSTPAHPKKMIPDPNRFSGDKEEFSGWRSAVRAKLKVDSVHFNSLENQTYYVAALLGGRARQWADPWVHTNEGTAAFAPEGLLDYLVKGFEDR